MDKNKYKLKHMGIPVEKHDTAAWANINSVIPESGVTNPSEMQVINAKEYVDSNEK